MISDGGLVVKQIKLNKDLTLEELKKHENIKVFFIKNGDFIFPIDVDGTLVALSGLYDCENYPLLDEIKITKLIKSLGQDGWKKCLIL